MQAINNFRPSTRIFNPNFLEIDVRYSEYGSTFSDYLCSHIIKNNLYFDVLIEYGDWNGELSREVYRMGKAEKVISVVNDEHDKELQKALNEMYYMTEEKVYVTMNKNIMNTICDKKVGVIFEGKKSQEIWEIIRGWNIDVSNIFLVAEHNMAIEEFGNYTNGKNQLIAQKCIGGKQVDFIQIEVRDDNGGQR